MKSVALSALVAGSLVLAAPLAQAVPITYTAVLSGPAEAPPNDSPGTGTATVIFDLEADSMRVMASFSGLVAPTVAAHIHCCTPAPFTLTAGVATQVPSFDGFPLGVTSGTFDNTFTLSDAGTWNPAFVGGGTVAEAVATFAAALDDGRTYFNIHSVEFPGGEIRGFLSAASTGVPAPGTLALLGGAALIGGWFARWRPR